MVRYRDHESVAVRNQLGFHWNQFDTETYAEEVVRHLLDTPGTTIAVRTAQELAALGRLGGHHDVEVFGDLGPELITQALGEAKLRSLSLVNHPATDLGFLAGYRRLTRLRLMECPGVISLAPLAGIPLQELILRGSTPWQGIEVMGREVPLQRLLLPPSARDLSFLASFPSLRQLGLDLDTPPTEEDWQAVTALKRLTVLSLNLGELTALKSQNVRLENVTRISLVSQHQTPDLGSLVTVFPEVTWLYVFQADEVDLSPLAAAARLSHVLTSFPCRVHNATALPPYVEVNPRPKE